MISSCDVWEDINNIFAGIMMRISGLLKPTKSQRQTEIDVIYNCYGEVVEYNIVLNTFNFVALSIIFTCKYEKSLAFWLFWEPK